MFCFWVFVVCCPLPRAGVWGGQVLRTGPWCSHWLATEDAAYPFYHPSFEWSWQLGSPYFLKLWNLCGLFTQSCVTCSVLVSRWGRGEAGPEDEVGDCQVPGWSRQSPGTWRWRVGKVTGSCVIWSLYDRCGTPLQRQAGKRIFLEKSEVIPVGGLAGHMVNHKKSWRHTGGFVLEG